MGEWFRKDVRRKGKRSEYLEDIFNPKRLKKSCPKGSERPKEEYTDDETAVFGCRSGSLPVINPNTGSVCCVLPAEERLEDLTTHIRRLSKDVREVYGDESLQNPEISDQIVLKALQLTYPAEYKNFTVRINKKSGLLEVRSRGRSVNRLAQVGEFGFGTPGKNCRFGAPSPQGQGVGGCKLSKGRKGDLVPRRREDGTVCCQLLDKEDQTTIVNNLRRTTNDLYYLLNNSSKFYDLFRRDNNSIVNRVIEAVSVWTIENEERDRRRRRIREDDDDEDDDRE